MMTTLVLLDLSHFFLSGALVVASFDGGIFHFGDVNCLIF